MSKAKVAKQRKVGGVSFLISVVVLWILVFSNLTTFPELVPQLVPLVASAFIFGILGSFFLCRWLVRGHWGVLIHEWKHSIVSNLVGNRSKGMHIRKETGHFEYEYTQATAQYNTLIALAPYFFPLALPCAALFSVLLWDSDPAWIAVSLGIGVGTDLALNVRDLGPYQTDFKNLRGGYPLGLLYCIAFQLLLFTIVVAWLASGRQGLLVLVERIAAFVILGWEWLQHVWLNHA